MKFAYLIMAHHRFDILKLLLEELDDERNDIFLHIDRKTRTVDMDALKSAVHKSKLIFVDRIPVFWGDFSQIQCVINLLKAATQESYHDYYHLLVGVEFPLKSQDQIHKFFEEHKGKEFIGFDKEDRRFPERIKYYYLFKKYARHKTKKERYLNRLGDMLLSVQRRMGINRIKGRETEYRKGYANWSITHKLACCIVNKEKQIRKRYHHTLCADEVFIHTLVYHSEFYERVYDKEDEYHSAMRLTSWEDQHNQMHREDLPMLLHTDKLFARKFDDEHALEIIKDILKSRSN